MTELTEGKQWVDATAGAMDRLLWGLRDDPQVTRFAIKALGPLFEHDGSSKRPLFPTLEAYCAHAGSKTEAARDLHLNRTAMYARIARLEEILDCDLSDPEVLLSMHLAVRAYRTCGFSIEAPSTPVRRNARMIPS